MSAQCWRGRKITCTCGEGSDTSVVVYQIKKQGKKLLCYGQTKEVPSSHRTTLRTNVLKLLAMGHGKPKATAKYWPWKRRLAFVCGCKCQCVFLWTFVVIKLLVTWYNTGWTVHYKLWRNLSLKKQTTLKHFSFEQHTRKQNDKSVNRVR